MKIFCAEKKMLHVLELVNRPACETNLGGIAVGLDVEKVILETMAAGRYRVSLWKRGWLEKSAPDETHCILAGTLLELMDCLHDAGFAVREYPYPLRHARALRGEVVRVDVWRTFFGIVVRTFPRGWVATTPPLSERFFPHDYDYFSFLDNFRENGWTVRTWNVGMYEGGRAWKGELKPVRSRENISAMRNYLQNSLLNRTGGAEYRHFNLAFDL